LAQHGLLGSKFEIRFEWSLFSKDR